MKFATSLAAFTLMLSAPSFAHEAKGTEQQSAPSSAAFAKGGKDTRKPQCNTGEQAALV
jgi:hypothetical protein